MPATIQLDFDPSASILGLSIRLETLALAGIVFLVLVLVAIGSGRIGAGAIAVDDAARRALPKLRRDDLILIAFGAVPGAVVGGRLDYVLLHLDYYRADNAAIADPAQGGFGLTLAVVAGTITGIAVARLLAAPVARWLGVAAVPVLLGLGLSKLAMALGGGGQGGYSTASWATSYVHAGDWGSVNPSFPAVPSQLIEGGLVLAGVAILMIPPALLRFRVRRWGRIARPGRAPRHDWRYLSGWRRYLVALGLWAVARFAVAFTWRDARVLGSLDVEQIILLVLAAFTIVALQMPMVGRAIRRAWVALAARRAAGRAARTARIVAEAEASGVVAETETAPVAETEADPANGEAGRAEAEAAAKTQLRTGAASSVEPGL